MVATLTKLREEFAQLAENMSRESLREFLRNNCGEQSQCDFKRDWPALPEMARDVIGIANSGGGVIVLGIAENSSVFEIVGIVNPQDENQVRKQMERFLPASLRTGYGLFTFAYEHSEYGSLNGLTFQVIVVGDAPEHLPFVTQAEWEKDGKSVRRNTIYGRSGSSTEPASHDQIQDMLNRRIETGRSSRPEMELERETRELKFLYGQIQPTVIKGGWFDQYEAIRWAIGEGAIGGKREHNPDYPEEGFDQFIARMIEGKKRRIEKMLQVDDSYNSDTNSDTLFANVPSTVNPPSD